GTGHSFSSRCESLVAPGGVAPGGAHQKPLWPNAASGPRATPQVSVDAYSCWSFGRSACSLLDMAYETLRAARTSEKKPEPIGCAFCANAQSSPEARVARSSRDGRGFWPPTRPSNELSQTMPLGRNAHNVGSRLSLSCRFAPTY